MNIPDPHSDTHRFGEPYSSNRPVPNIQGYKEQLESRKNEFSNTTNTSTTPINTNTNSEATPPETPTSSDTRSDDGYVARFKSMLDIGQDDENTTHQPTKSYEDYYSSDKPKESHRDDQEHHGARHPMSPADLAARTQQKSGGSSHDDQNSGTNNTKDSSNSSKPKDETNGRTVTDPVTHLPVEIHDSTQEELEAVAIPDIKGNVPGQKEPGTGDEDEVKWSQKRHDSLQMLVDQEMDEDADGNRRSYREPWGLYILRHLIPTPLVIMLVHWDTTHLSKQFNIADLGFKVLLGVLIAPILLTFMYAIERYLFPPPRTDKTKRKSTREAQESNIAEHQHAETAAWLNNTLNSVWPLVNPDLFVSLADMLEDVMQASLPKLVKMVRVSDLGQGNEPVRILGVRWLREGDATREKDGMKAEKGDFVNLEIALAYRARPSSRDVSSKVKNAHLLLEFFLAGAIPFPVWVELKGMIGTCRVRIQTTPDPPFFSEMTFTFLGQPKVTLSCIPLMKRMPNLMNIPLISSFVQSSVDAALNEYIAPKSLSLDLKQTLMGDDFKKDTNGKGILIVRIICARGFKNGDGSKSAFDKLGKVVGMSGASGSDAYVSISWSKYGKALWLSRIITNCQTPSWDELTALIYGPAELNADEKLQLSLMDSDRTTADDSLGVVEVDLREILKEDQNGKMNAREDRFMKKDGKGEMPGTLKWEVGWFGKTMLTDHQVRNSSKSSDQQKADPAQVERDVATSAKRKTREATQKDETSEVDQQKDEDMKVLADDIIDNAAPLDEFPSGILSIQIHQISNLELEKLGTDRKHHNEDEEEHEEGDDLPSSYCVVTLNHRKIYKTRVKPKSSMPFFNAATERFIPDFKTAEVIISVHDNRLHENNPILGCVVLPLHHVFKSCSQICHTYPLVGGLGYGRIRISLVFRSVTAKLPRNFLGWDVGTLAVEPTITASGLPQDIASASRITMTTNHDGKAKLPVHKGDAGTWSREKEIHLPIKQRYSSHLLLSFRNNRLGADATVAFAVLWLKDIVDDEDLELDLPVWKHDDENLICAEQNCEESYGERVGTIKVKLRYWSGLSGYHSKLAKSDDHMASVMAILESASEGKELRDDVSDEASNSSDGDSSDDERGGNKNSQPEREEKKKLSESGKRSLLDDVREYKENRKELHRHHRGLMQWKAIRGLNWAKEEVKDTTKHAFQKVTGRDQHERKKDAVETEV